MTNKPTSSTETEDFELLQILADYSNDLAQLEKRDGDLPAQAAVKRLNRIIRNARADELVETYNKNFIHWGDNMDKAKFAVSERIYQLSKEEVKS
jgi:hypothetical protein